MYPATTVDTSVARFVRDIQEPQFHQLLYAEYDTYTTLFGRSSTREYGFHQRVAHPFGTLSRWTVVTSESGSETFRTYA